VHTEIAIEDIPLSLRYLEIKAADSLTIETVLPRDLGPNWQEKFDHTRRIGDEWLRSGKTALLRVPSVISPHTWNMLINPAHKGSTAIRTAKIHSHVVDRRLLR
jgi:RES domain-containing protein